MVSLKKEKKKQKVSKNSLGKGIEQIMKEQESTPDLLVDRKDLIEEAAKAYEKFMDVLIPKWRDDPNSKDTPMRVAKAYVTDLWSGFYSKEPKITVFENEQKYTGVVFQGDIPVVSMCSHHHLSFTGKAHIAYIPADKIIGLSKLNRIVDFFSRRPSVQENLTMQIHKFLSKTIFEKEDKGSVAVYIEANHTCCSNRGIKHSSTMKTSKLSGAFLDEADCRAEFYQFISDLK